MIVFFNIFKIKYFFLFFFYAVRGMHRRYDNCF